MLTAGLVFLGGVLAVAALVVGVFTWRAGEVWIAAFAAAGVRGTGLGGPIPQSVWLHRRLGLVLRGRIPQATFARWR